MSDDTRETLYLVDGSGYLFRAFHALPPLTTSKGEPTGAMYGVANMLRRLINENKPKYAAVVFDAPGKTFRHRMYEQYKANRPPMPDELRSQIEPLLEITEVLGFPLLRVSDVEADDVIGTLARQAEQAGMNVVISTGDKDFAQLVGDHIQLINTMNDTVMDAAAVEEKFGVKPELIGDYLALIGDKVDNVPGVPKVGPKTATKWLHKFGSLQSLIERADEVGGKIGENLRNALPELPLSRDLVEIKTDVELDVGPTDLKLKSAEGEKLRDLLARWQFSTWLREVDVEAPAEEKADDSEYVTITDENTLAEWLERLKSAELLAVDTETTSVDPMRAELVGLCFATEPGVACYIPVGHTGPGHQAQMDRDSVLDALKPLLEDPDLPKVGQNLKYDTTVLAHYGISLAGVRFDTMLESFVYNSTAFRHDLDNLAAAYLGLKTTAYSDIAGKGAKQLSFDQVDLQIASSYAAEDADITLKLHNKLWPRIDHDEPLRSVFEDIEMPLVPVLARVEQNGVLLDVDRLKEHSKSLVSRLAELESAAHEAAGQAFNLGSPGQLQKILFEELGLPVIRKTPKGAPSTAEDVLQQLANDYPLPKLVLEHRALAKLKSTYTDKLPGEINPKTGRVHTSYQQAIAATGRLSSTDPNLQNIPIRTAEGRQIRQAFIAPEGYKILAADYSQIELRIMAHLSADEGLLSAFAAGKDIHAVTAAEVFGGEPDDVSAEHRRAAKAINFGLIYGMSAWGLGRQLNVGRNEAQEYIDRYFERYPGVRRYMRATREQARRKGYVETVFGRRLHLREINARQMPRRQAAERAAINAPMQGTAADIIKRAMIAIDRWLSEQPADVARMTMQVHDELVFEVKEEHLEMVRGQVVDQMQAAADLSVPLLVEDGIGNNWDEAH